MNPRPLLLLVAATLSPLALAEDAGSTRLQTVSAVELVSLLVGSTPPAVYDVRAEDEFKQAHLPGSALLSWGKDPATFVSGLPLPKTRLLVFYCNGPT